MWKRGVLLFWPNAIMLCLIIDILVELLMGGVTKTITPLGRKGPINLEDNSLISIHVFAWKRKRSLERLMESLLRAEYPLGTSIPLYIHIDGNPLPQVVEYAKEVYWPYGAKVVEVRDRQLGLPMAILDGWHPTRDDEWALLLEDDIAVAPSYMEWINYCISYHNATKLEGLLGCSLYTPIVDEIGPAPNAWSPPPWNVEKVIGKDEHVFAFQLPCSWGTLWNGRRWRQFLEYHAIRHQMPPTAMPEVPNSRSNEWFSSWKRILIELMLFKGWFLLYPSFPRHASFSTNYFEPGVHSVPEGQEPSFPDSLRAGDRRFTVPLIEKTDLKILRNDTQIPWVNLYHQRVAGPADLLGLVDMDAMLQEANTPALTNFIKRQL